MSNIHCLKTWSGPLQDWISGFYNDILNFLSLQNQIYM